MRSAATGALGAVGGRSGALLRFLSPAFYELEPGRRLGWEIEQLADELAAVFGRSVDLVAAAALHRRLKDAVLSEARTLYAA
jgi:hypothetical protein